jgi:hypothetical protein
VRHFQHLVDKDPGLVGNLLVARVLGAHIDLVSEEEYGKIGSVVYMLFPMMYSVTALIFHSSFFF